MIDFMINTFLGTRISIFFVKSVDPNKRPRGLYALLDHLLDKRILVLCELTTVVAVPTSLKI